VSFPFQLRPVAPLIAILSLLAPDAKGAMAQSPEFRLAALDPKETVVEPPPLPKSPEPFAVTNSSADTLLPNNVGTYPDRCEKNNATYLSNGGSSELAQNISRWMKIGQGDTINAALIGATVVGAASTYNPYSDGNGSDEKQTSSGEPYNPDTWTAAIRIDLREQFGGVRYGKDYRPSYALVESGDKHLIVKINDVGPLGRDRVIDLNERSMRYFDSSLQAGLVRDVKVALLSGEDWTPGPIENEQPSAGPFCLMLPNDLVNDFNKLLAIGSGISRVIVNYNGLSVEDRG
jgi:peptidoglycan lytic transglycosylase